jgi:hypothetical protein
VRGTWGVRRSYIDTGLVRVCPPCAPLSIHLPLVCFAPRFFIMSLWLRGRDIDLCTSYIQWWGTQRIAPPHYFVLPLVLSECFQNCRSKCSELESGNRQHIINWRTRSVKSKVSGNVQRFSAGSAKALAEICRFTQFSQQTNERAIC